MSSSHIAQTINLQHFLTSTIDYWSAQTTAKERQAVKEMAKGLDRERIEISKAHGKLAVSPIP